MEVGDQARARARRCRVLGVDAALDGVALEHDLVLGEAERRAGGDADLLAHQVDAGDRLGDRMLDLQAGVHLDEEELAVLVQELDGADAEVAELAHGVDHDLADPVALLGVEGGRGGLLQHLLVAALQRAVALAQMHDVAVAVGDHLDLDVARLAEVLLQIDRVVAEGGLGLDPARSRTASAASSAVVDTFMPRPPPPAAALISTGIADLLADRRRSPRPSVTAPSEPGTTRMPAP